ncbi:hypothetical protein SAJA_03650 [Salinisphaera japonica YTM-1]|uniref:Uncharacterized protein n=1 Tax=Salinisphaera japonica YTM-1 TaxID=1209778 RepID=A0A423PZP5_9GAMM|nr:hypothetical protein SAJA_03650 [Salinisphaera japonica YTM-1]
MFDAITFATDFRPKAERSTRLFDGRADKEFAKPLPANG